MLLGNAPAEQDHYSDCDTVAMKTTLGRPQSGRDDHPIIEVKMGQGVAGSLKEIKACSKEHFSCPGIVFFNSETKRGGIFHVPANWKHASRITKHSIFAMMKEIQPDTVYLDKRPPESWNAVGIRSATLTSQPGDDDWIPIQNFIKTDCKYKGAFDETPKSVSGGIPSQFLAYVDESGKLLIETRWGDRTDVSLGKDKTEEGQQRIFDAMKDMPECIKFGIDCWPD